MPGDNIPESMGEDFSESVGEDISEQAGAIISESVGGFPRNQQQIWNNGKMPDFKQAREQKKHDDANVKRIMRNFKKRPIDRLPE
jgi:hypothetical protein